MPEMPKILASVQNLRCRVFIDGKLVLDMGSDHYNAKGKIDFATGKATVDKAVTYSTSSPNNVNDLAADIETNKEYYFKDKIDGYNSTTQKYSNKPHTMTIFYMERGMGDSNLLIRYNYSTLNNFSKMKIQEITAFDGVNPGLLDLTKKAAENDVFKYTVYNTGTDSADVKVQAKVYPDDPFKVKVRLKSLHLPEYNLMEDAGCDDIFADQIMRWVNRIYSILQFNTTYEFEIGDPEK